MSLNTAIKGKTMKRILVSMQRKALTGSNSEWIADPYLDDRSPPRHRKEVSGLRKTHTRRLQGQVLTQATAAFR